MANLKVIGRGVLCVVAGIATTVVLSYGTDFVLQAAGLLQAGNLPIYGSEILIVSIVIYRTLFNAVGSYVMAALAPSHPMRYVWGLGIFGLLTSVGAAISTAGSNIAPGWYAWSLAILALPAVLLGGKLYVKYGKAVK
jgi:hypothetical protein